MITSQADVYVINVLLGNKHVLKLTSTSIEAAERYRACNAETIVSHFAIIEHLFHEHNIDASRICNFDESSKTRNRRILCQRRTKHYGVRNNPNRLRNIQPELSNFARVTLLASVLASGYTGRPIFVFEDTCIPYLTVLKWESMG